VAAGAVAAALLGGPGAAILLAPGEPAIGARGPGVAVATVVLACLVGFLGVARASTHTIAFGAGAALVALRLLAGSVLPVATPPGALPAPLHATKVEVLSISTPSNGAQRAVVSLQDPAAGQIRLYARLPRYPEVAPGDRLTLDGPVQPPPSGTGFGDYLRRAGVAGTVTARHLERVPAPSGPAAWLEHRRRDAGELLARVLPAPQAGLAAGILVGLRDQVDRDVAASFTAAGLTHIVAISGWNIAIVAAVVAVLLRGLTRRRRSAATLAAIVAYALAAGAGASVVRAAVMAAAVVGSRELGRPGTAAAALAMATLAMLLVEPAVVADAGFQLSVAATAGLLAWATGLTDWLRRRSTAPGRRLVAPTWLIDSLGVSLAAQAATLPLILLDFGRVSLISPLANLVAAPLVVPVMAASAAALAAGWLVSLGAPPALGAIVGSGGAVVLGALVAVGRAAAAVPGASITLGTPLAVLSAVVAALCVGLIGVPQARRRTLGLVGLTIAGLGLAPAGDGRTAKISGPAPNPPLRSARTVPPHANYTPEKARPGRCGQAQRRLAATHPLARMLRPLALLALAALVALVLVASARPDGRLHVSILDVGQGDAILLQGPSGSRILVDTGPDPERLLPQLDARIPAWDRRLDLLLLTHPHEDHVGGAALLLRRYRIARIAEPGMRGTGPGWDALAAELGRQARQTWHPAAGTRMHLDAVSLAVLWPRRGEVTETPGRTGTAVNNTSIVLDIRYGARRVLLMGDAEQEVDAALLADGSLSASQPRVDLLKVAHHGSRTATTAPFLAATRPAVAVVSVGADNPFGHPAPATLDRLRAAGARVLRTDLDGPVTATTDGTDLRVESATGAWVVTSGSASAAVTGPRAPAPNEPAPGCIESPRGSIARRSGRHPARSRSPRMAADARRRGRGDRVVSGRAIRSTRHRSRQGTGGGRSPPP
jgi:competence protein ComEC